MLEEVARRRKRTIRISDLEWIGTITSAPRQLLRDMDRSGRLHRVGENRYIVAPEGTTTIEQAAPAELLVDLIVGPLGDYCIAFLSSLIAHRLTDLDSSITYVAAEQGTNPRGRLPLPLKVVQLSGSLWPDSCDGGDEVDRFRVLAGTKEFAYRSTLERALIDGLVRPDLCAGFETVALSWARALTVPDVSWEKVAAIGGRLNPATARRTAFMLRALGLDRLAAEAVSEIDTRSANTRLDRSDGFSLGRAGLQRDPSTGILLNVPRDHLRGWVEAER